MICEERGEEGEKKRRQKGTRNDIQREQEDKNGERKRKNNLVRTEEHEQSK